MSDAHESPIKTPKQLITVILLCFFVPITLLILLAGWVSSGDKLGAGTEVFSKEAINDRIKPVAVSEYKAAGSTPAQTGEQVYQAVCTGCHAAGLAGAPKFGDVAAWGPRLKVGLNGLVASVIKGKNAMPARGGNPDLTDIEIQNAVIYIGNAAGAGFKAVAPAATPTSVSTAPSITPTSK